MGILDKIDGYVPGWRHTLAGESSAPAAESAQTFTSSAQPAMSELDRMIQRSIAEGKTSSRTERVYADSDDAAYKATREGIDWGYKNYQEGSSATRDSVHDSPSYSTSDKNEYGLTRWERIMGDKADDERRAIDNDKDVQEFRRNHGKLSEYNPEILNRYNVD